MRFRRGSLGRSAWHALVALVAMAVVAGTTVFLVEYAAGDFASNYQLTASFSSAGEGLHPGSEVDERGVEIGTVKSISLANGMAQVVMAIGDQFKLPTNVVAAIRSENLFGAEQVVMEPPARPAATTLQNDSSVRQTRVEDQLGQLFATAAPLLDKLNTTDLASVLADLSEAADGEGPAIKASIDEGTRLADLLSQTSVAQLRALDAFSRFTDSIASVGPAINTISADSNQSLPVFDQAATAYHELLGDVSVLADNVSTLLSDYRPDIATIINSGGNITRVLISDQTQLEQVITGLYEYAYRFGHASNGARLPDGSEIGYFKTFVDWVNVEQLVCGLIAPAVPGLSFLAPLQQVVSEVDGPLDCSSEIKQFKAAQGHSATTGGKTSTNSPSTSTLGGATSTPSTAGTAPAAPSSAAALSTTGQQLAQQLYEEMSQPQSSGSSSVGTYIESLLGNG
jgi:phospholipid/cholesterol/gamma-HCH transport system substrate-binding protein